MLIGRPDQDLFEATLQIKDGFQGQLKLEKGERDYPKFNVLKDFMNLS